MRQAYDRGIGSGHRKSAGIIKMTSDHGSRRRAWRWPSNWILTSCRSARPKSARRATMFPAARCMIQDNSVARSVETFNSEQQHGRCSPVQQRRRRHKHILRPSTGASSNLVEWFKLRHALLRDLTCLPQAFPLSCGSDTFGVFACPAASCISASGFRPSPQGKQGRQDHHAGLLILVVEWRPAPGSLRTYP